MSKKVLQAIRNIHVARYVHDPELETEADYEERGIRYPEPEVGTDIRGLRKYNEKLVESKRQALADLLASFGGDATEPGFQTAASFIQGLFMHYLKLKIDSFT